MDTTRKQFLQIGLLLAVAGCKKSTTEIEVPVGEGENDAGYFPRKVYAYQHHETTGLTDCIYVGKREQTIQFAYDCDKKALRRLRGLRGDVLLPLADGKHLFVVGDLSRTEMWTPGGKNQAAKESYRDFCLHDWYIVAPFEEWRNLEGIEESQIIPRTGLRISDFDHRLLPDLYFDPHRYQKTAEEHRLYVAQFASR